MSELPEGRKPLLCSDMTFGEARYDTKGRRVLAGHPSTWERECEQLRLENTRLRAALRDVIGMTDEIAKAPMTADRWADRIEETALAALQTAPQRDDGTTGD